VLWWLADDAQLAATTRDVIATADLVAVSAATAWEIGIKQALGKLTGPDDLAGELERNRFTQLPITLDHALLAGRLPRHHDDPFDRMLIAQARSSELVVVTRDRRFAQYGVATLTA